MPIQDRIQEKLSRLKPRSLSEEYSRQAAVLMPIFERDAQPHFLLTRRTEEVQTHKGQISFPGGMREGGESLEHTALRETFEEIGIPGNNIRVLGRFHDYLSITDFSVRPFAGYLTEPFDLRPQLTEVAEILFVPFRIFRDPSLFRMERWNRRDRVMDVCFYTFGSDEIWGLTARIIKDFLQLLDQE